MSTNGATERPILILSASAGAGHMMAARAIEQALRAAAPGVSIEVLDVLSAASGAFRRMYAGGYLSLVRRAPVLMGVLYERMDQPVPNIADRARLLIQNAHAPRIARCIRAHRPRAIVNTHFLSAEIVSQMRRSGALNCPQATVTTDFETHRLWVQEPTERYFAASEQGRVLLRRWGVDDLRIRVTGIPVMDAFRPTANQSAVRTELGLDPARPVVLLLCGGFGVGPVALAFQEILALLDTQLVAVCGRNEALRERLALMSKGAESRCKVVGFTNEMHRYMQAADVAVTKPGGLTSSEALACGLPMVVVNPIPGQESRNSDFLLESGAAIKANDACLVGPRIRSLLSSPTRLAAMRDAALREARPDAARQIAEAVGEMCGASAV
ncbi:MAG: glycosyltransferase [Phycisphaerales bacterium]|nr:glycosyltransferase [Phycisphaerales bacterium]